MAQPYQLPVHSRWHEDLNAKDLQLGRSVLALSVATMAVSFACVAGTFGMSKIAHAQAAPAPQPAEPTEEEYYVGLSRDAARYREMFDPNRTIFNPRYPDIRIPGRSYRELTAENFQSYPRELDEYLLFALLTYYREYYDIVDSIKPTAMNREQFLHVLLREVSRRSLFRQLLNRGEFVPPSLTSRRVTISRPLDASPVQRSTATLYAGSVAYRDVATSLLQNPSRIEVELARDISEQIGVVGNRRFTVSNEMMGLIIGYAAGENSDFFNGRQRNPSVGPLPLTLGFNNSVTEEQLRTAYCAIVPAVANPGRTQGVDLNMAVSAGFLMAREDASLTLDVLPYNYVGLSFRGVVCPATPPVWNPATMSSWITGIDLLQQQATTQP